MNSQRPNLPILIGLVLSLGVHAMILIPYMVKSFLHEGRTQMLEARFAPDDISQPEEPETPEEPQTPLGIDADTPSSLTWVGYDQYQEHIAALAEMDQAAFEDQPVTPPPSPPQEQPTVEVTEQEMAATETAEPTPEPEPAPQPAVEATITPENLQAMRNVMDTLARLLTEPIPKPETATDETPDAPRTPAEDEKQVAATPAQPTPDKPAPPQPAQPVQPELPKPGDQADRESDATSVIEAAPANWKSGKPLASPGLEIRTRKPTLTILQRISLSAKNPLCRIKFAANGVPKSVDFLERSGSRDFDQAIKASLYRWRARGKRLQELKKDQTADVDIRIIIRK